MGLLEKIESEMRSAMKAGDTLKSDTLKMLKTDITYEKARTGEDVSEDKIIEVITRAAKKRKEAAEEYLKAGRDELAEKESKELAIIQEYLPEMLSEEDVEIFITAAIEAMGGVTKKDFGRVMGQLMKDLKGKADGAIVKDILNRKLQ